MLQIIEKEGDFMDLLINKEKEIKEIDNSTDNEEYWDKWDKEIEKDSEEGKLDFLIKEAIDAKLKGYSKSL
ncbi:MAG TPA: hypothetical protein PKJ95_07230 [Atribacterota bacterium]|nr:hypothetical protein [Atribacterota bacterium]